MDNKPNMSLAAHMFYGLQNPNSYLDENSARNAVPQKYLRTPAESQAFRDAAVNKRAMRNAKRAKALPRAAQ